MDIDKLASCKAVFLAAGGGAYQYIWLCAIPLQVPTTPNPVLGMLVNSLSQCYHAMRLRVKVIHLRAALEFGRARNKERKYI